LERTVVAQKDKLFGIQCFSLAIEGDDTMGDEEIIEMNEFVKLDVRIGKIVNAEKIKGSKKLIKLDVDVGDETRQLVAGIAEEYTPEGLIGTLVPLLVNLKPAKLMGVESRGMILAVDVGGKPILLHPDKEVPAGSRVR
jgi:methionyl-tRNA synthetase